MHASFIADVIFASLMVLGGTTSLVRMYLMANSEWMSKELLLALIDTSWKNLFNLGWGSRYHLMTFYNVACLAAVIHWHLVFSGAVIVLLYVASAGTLIAMKHRLNHDNTLSA